VEERLNKNVRRVLPGPKAALTRKGKKSAAKANWNPFFFAQRALLKNMDGQTYEVPPRPLIVPPSESQRRAWAEEYLRTVTGP
jgi:hypothetical protein